MFVCPSLPPSLPPVYFRMANMTVLEGDNSSNGIIINGTMSDDEVVASELPPRYLCKLVTTFKMNFNESYSPHLSLSPFPLLSAVFELEVPQ